jgi:hypothetical protein
MPSKHELVQGPDIVTYTRPPSQPSVFTAGPSSTITENGSNASSAPTRTPSPIREQFRRMRLRYQANMASQTPNFSNMIMPGGYFTGTWTYVPPGAAGPGAPGPGPSSQLAITAAEEPTAQDSGEASAAARDLSRTPQAALLQLPLISVCSVCDQEAENMQANAHVGNVCQQCLSHNSMRL